MTEKRCPRCGLVKSRGEFYPRNKGGDLLVSACKPCAREVARDWRNKHLDRAKAASRLTSRRRHLSSAYGLTEAEYDAMCVRQNGRCAICFDLPTGRHGLLYVDHDHLSGRVRGLLCEACNHGLGRFRDRPELLHNAIAYLNHDRCYVGGTFDLVHAGHVNLLREASKVGPVTVALNTDEFAERYKRRPIMSLAERVAVVSSFRYVDSVVVNEGGEDSSGTILQVQPRYIVHGDDWKGPALLKQLGISQDFLDDNNVEMLYIPYTSGISSSEVIARCKT